MGNCCTTEREQYEDNFNLRDKDGDPNIISNKFKAGVNVKSDSESVGKMNGYGLAIVSFIYY